MKVLMLGWEYPPHISGGLGTACEGLTLGLARHGLPITFVVPHLFGGEAADHMRLVDAREDVVEEPSSSAQTSAATTDPNTAKRLIEISRISAALSPYWTAAKYQEFLSTLYKTRGSEQAARMLGLQLSDSMGGHFQQYGNDIFEEVARYAGRVLERFRYADFDVIHAHDWMTYPAGVALSQALGKPLVLHVHSLEYDRSGAGANPRITEVERWGMSCAHKIIAVSYYTRELIQKIHGIPEDKMSVVHNGMYTPEVVKAYRKQKSLPAKVVLFLGRVTFQKGPDYFVEAAAKVVPFVPDVLFVMAGSGDMLERMINRVKELGIEKHFFFPGFLKGPEVEQIFSLADVYVMPSVSEPFGISALEAINYNTPVIVSKQSGVSEVLSHALKVDFWDIDRLADLIINSLQHQELRDDMVRMAREEVKRLHWDVSASKTIEIYREIVG